MSKNNFKSLLKSSRMDLGLSQKELATLIGTSPAIVSKYESGKSQPRTDTIKKIASVLKLSDQVLLDSLTLPSDEQIEIPYFELSACEEQPGYRMQPLPKKSIYILEDSLAQLNPSSLPIFATSAFGESMTPLINHNDIVFIKNEPSSQFIDGKIYALVFQNHIFIKRVFITKLNGLELHSANPQYPPIVVNAEQMRFLKIIGLVIYRAGYI
ncbi:LexA family transcriptional regulator [Neisseriaceae bacterium ESL0693]|nr:LexA family transcriptional regulator [Neisseriaceae bacterium ESL0693]